MASPLSGLLTPLLRIKHPAPWSWPDRQDGKDRERDANLMANNLPALAWLCPGWDWSADGQDNS